MFRLTKKIICAGVCGIILAISAVAVGTYFGLHNRYDETLHEGAVVSNGHECADIGGSILRKGGSAVDSAIAVLFCEGVAVPQSTGIGGGFLMTIYVKKSNTSETLDARETAPSAATEDMYHGNASVASKGGLSIAVPGELRGYWYAHQKYGRLPWRDLVQPTIDLCKNGHKITAFLANAFANSEHQIRKDPGLNQTFIDPKTNSVYKEGDIVKRLSLAKTLEIIARDGADALYDGVLTKKFVTDIRGIGGIITEDDLKAYKPVWNKPVVADVPNNLTLYSIPLPGSGPILTFILNMMKNFLHSNNINDYINWQRITEAFKFGYGKRSELGDAPFVEGIENLIKNLTSASYALEVRSKITDNVTFQDPRHYGANFSLPNDQGTAHVSILAPNGDAVSVTGTINQIFGSGFQSVSTGIILNDEMDDFSSPNITNGFGLPPSPPNFIKPGKRPLSSMSPTIIVDKNGNVVLILGAAGGSKITTSTALIIMRHLWFNETIKEAVSSYRLHHQLVPMQIDMETSFNQTIRAKLEKIGHTVRVVPSGNGFAAATAISRRNGVVEGTVDPRRGGSICIVN
ncbi:hypothetical protein FQA39_LY00178 [Lamprigera yunnana]|nr:hypothetical protein FQA39_LY00178 [Lamprigera yunnana]